MNDPRQLSSNVSTMFPVKASDLATGPRYQIVRVPPYLHQSWIDIAYQAKADGLEQAYLQQMTVSMLRKWFQSVYSTHRLCGFEEFTPREVEILKLPIQPGFYLRIRQLTPDELRHALEMEAREAARTEEERKALAMPGVQPEYNPRWMLEGKQGYLTELREADPQKYLA